MRNAEESSNITQETLSAVRLQLRSWHYNKTAIENLLSHGQEGIDSLLRIVEQEKNRLERLTIRCSRFYVPYLLLLCFLVKSFPILTFLAQWLPVFLYFGWVTHRQTRLAKILTYIPNKRVIPHLLEFTWHFSERSGSTEAILKTLLTQLTFEDAYLLPITPLHRKAIHRLLNSEDEALVVSALIALGQIGDETSKKPVADLLYFTDSKIIDQHCRECYASLEQHSSRHAEAQNLLRPSSLAQDAQEQLLRPLSNTPAEPDEELLHSASNISTNDRVSPQ